MSEIRNLDYHEFGMVRVGIPSKGMRDWLRGAYRICFAIDIIFSFDYNVFLKKFCINASIIDAAK